MNNRLRNTLFGGGLIAAALIAMPALAADGNLMEITIHTEQQVSGMGQLPAQTVQRKICMSAKRFDTEQLLKSVVHSGCKLTNYKSAGELLTFDVVCDKPIQVTSHAEFHGNAANFTGNMHSDVNANGHAMSLDANYTGTKVGTCDYVPPKD